MTTMEGVIVVDLSRVKLKVEDIVASVNFFTHLNLDEVMTAPQNPGQRFLVEEPLQYDNRSTKGRERGYEPLWTYELESASSPRACLLCRR